MIGGLGEAYVERLRKTYRDRVPGGADLVLFWFEKAKSRIASGRTVAAGFVATNSIRGGANRKVMDSIVSVCDIYDAWADEPWVIDGAAVRVSIVCFSGFAALTTKKTIDGSVVSQINADLTSNISDTTEASKLLENESIAFIGSQKGGPFEVSETQAQKFLTAPKNPNGRRNLEVLRPWINGEGVTRRNPRQWIIDFTALSDAEAALFEAPFQYIQNLIRDDRRQNREKATASRWWLHQRPRYEMRNAMVGLSRQIVSPRVSKYRLFSFFSTAVLVDSAAVAIARDDDTTFGILHSRFHELWALRMGTWLGVGNDPRYTPSTTFETFPFPEGLTPNIPAEKYKDDPRAKAIAAAAARLNELREAWLNPEDLVRREPEVVPGFPDRILPRTEKAAAELKKRTLTNLYNTKPQWLVDAHAALDRAVAAAYGWPSDMTDEEILARLLALNLERAKAQAAPAAVVADAADEDEPVAAKAKRQRKRKSAEK
jgi:type II restriction/modification system DNA methylase subunit YeeA